MVLLTVLTFGFYSRRKSACHNQLSVGCEKVLLLLFIYFNSFPWPPRPLKCLLQSVQRVAGRSIFNRNGQESKFCVCILVVFRALQDSRYFWNVG